MNGELEHIRSALPGMIWPALPDHPGAMMLAAQFQLEQTQWWPAAELERHQMRQLELLLRHAHDAIPFWRERLTAAGYAPGALPIRREWLSTLPLIDRREIQSRGEALFSASVPLQHGQIEDGQTTGSTGSPIKYRGTTLTQFFWRAYVLRDHLWHRRDLAAHMAVIRSGVGERTTEGWGPATDAVFSTGKISTLDISKDIDAQLDWLSQHAPAYLLTYPSNLRGLLDRAAARGMGFPGLREVRTIAETVDPELRASCRQSWGVPLVDIYSANEAGYIALQCPESGHYHIQAEHVLVELLREDGSPCLPGEVGRVVLTLLHNFAMPLIRYEIGDYAEAGGPCACGRGLPVIRRIMGRRRNLLVMPDGSKHWPSFPSEKWSHVAPIRQLQMIQRSPAHIDVRIVAQRALTAGEKNRLMELLRTSLRYPYGMKVDELSWIPRQPGGKYEEFICEVPD
jgi:phenylacetate-CoA ligase